MFDTEIPRKEFYIWFPTWMHRVMQSELTDSRNQPVARVLWSIWCTTLPCALLFAIIEPWLSPWTYTAASLLCFGCNTHLYLRSFILAFHYSEHNPIFTRPWMNKINAWITCNFFGIPLGMYNPHHLWMHHVEDNAYPMDISSTLPYDRTSPYSIVFYCLRYILLVYFELPLYFVQKKQWSRAIQIIAGLTVYAELVFVLGWFRPLFTGFFLVLPFVFTGIQLMMGNYKQHLFVDVDTPSVYRCTYTCICNESNSYTFNDGYHIEHHLHSKLDWHRLPEFFASNIDNHIREYSFIFQGVDTNQVYGLVIQGKFDVLYQHLVDLGPLRNQPRVFSYESFRRECLRRLQRVTL